jgi:hypothetical protein
MTVLSVLAPLLMFPQRFYADECGTRSCFLLHARAATHREAALWGRINKIRKNEPMARCNESGCKTGIKRKNIRFSSVDTTPRMQACMHDDTCNHSGVRNKANQI